MTNGFLKDWERDEREPLSARVSGHLHHKIPMREQLSNAIYRIKVQENKLESATMRMQQHDRDIFSKCVNAKMSHDLARASMYANECAEVRKMAKITLQCQLALEQVSLRLETINEFGDIAQMMAPVANVVHSIKNQISGVIPEVGFELNQIGEVLNGVVLEAGETSGESYEIEASDGESQRILSEANVIAEQHMKEKFPDLPTSALQEAHRVGESSIPH